MTANYAGGRQSSGFCRIVGADFKDTCYEGLGTVLGTLRPTTAGRKAACTRFTPKRFLGACLRGAGVPVTA